jgi:hypothetical protein
MKPAATVRRQQGRYYTPEWLAQRMVADALARFRADEGEASAAVGPLRILDPSCGDGVFLVAALQTLCADIMRPEQWKERCDLAARTLHGVDTDPLAIAQACDNLVHVISPPEFQREYVHQRMLTRLRLGDALLGQGFAPDEIDGGDQPQALAVNANQSVVPPLDWLHAFPEAAADGGFDLIVGNPPYRRERDSREMFERVARSPLGRRWRQPRMDLWHYFAHRAIDLLKPGGRLAFVVSGYWSGARSAGLLVKRLREETVFEELHLLGNAAIFPGVSGRHMTFQVRKGAYATPCLIHEDGTTRSASASELFARGRLVTTPASELSKTREAHGTLGDRFDVRQGIAENPPRIARTHLTNANEASSPWKLREGVFVLSLDEIAAIPWNEAERRLFRPYITPAEVGRFRAPEVSGTTLLYLHRHTTPTLDGLPHIAAHLSRFRPLLERRREVENGRIAWWHLHWPREERLFLEPRILAVQMVREPRFCVAIAPTFVGFSVNVIRPAMRFEQDSACNVIDRGQQLAGLHALCGLLNSSFARDWFQRHAKQRGVNLDISGTLLKEFPLPTWDDVDREDVAQLARCRANCNHREEETLDGAIDCAVERWLGQASDLS